MATCLPLVQHQLRGLPSIDLYIVTLVSGWDVVYRLIKLLFASVLCCFDCVLVFCTYD